MKDSEEKWMRLQKSMVNLVGKVHAMEELTSSVLFTLLTHRPDLIDSAIKGIENSVKTADQNWKNKMPPGSIEAYKISLLHIRDILLVKLHQVGHRQGNAPHT